MISRFSSALTASGDDGNEPINTIDGDLATRWSCNGNGQWIQYDLGSVHSVGTVEIAFYLGNERQTYFDLAVSDDGASWNTVATGLAGSGTTLLPDTGTPLAPRRH